MLNGGDIDRSHLSAANMGMLYRMRPGARIDSLRLSDLELINVGALLRCDRAVLRNATIERIRHDARYFGGNGAGPLLISYGWTENLAMRDFRVRGLDPITNRGDIYAAVTLAGNKAKAGALGKGFVFERFLIEDLWTNYPGYANRDGFAIERGFEQGMIRDGRISGVADGGIDLKARGWVLERIEIARAYASLKLWTGVSGSRLRSVEPRDAHFWVMGDVSYRDRTTVRLEELTVEGDPRKPIVKFDRGRGRPPVDVVITGRWDPGQVLWMAARGTSIEGSSLTVNGQSIDLLQRRKTAPAD